MTKRSATASDLGPQLTQSFALPRWTRANTVQSYRGRRRRSRHDPAYPSPRGAEAASRNNGLPDTEIEAAANRAGVVVRAVSRFYRTAPSRAGLMLGFSGFPPSVICTSCCAFGESRERRACDRLAPAAYPGPGRSMRSYCRSHHRRPIWIDFLPAGVRYKDRYRPTEPSARHLSARRLPRKTSVTASAGSTRNIQLREQGSDVVQVPGVSPRTGISPWM